MRVGKDFLCFPHRFHENSDGKRDTARAIENRCHGMIHSPSIRSGGKFQRHDRCHCQYPDYDIVVCVVFGVLFPRFEDRRQDMNEVARVFMGPGFGVALARSQY